MKDLLEVCNLYNLKLYLEVSFCQKLENIPQEMGELIKSNNICLYFASTY